VQYSYLFTVASAKTNQCRYQVHEAQGQEPKA